MKLRWWGLLRSLSLLLAIVSFIVWIVALFDPLTIPDFMETDGRVALAQGYVYVNVPQPPPDAKARATIAEMDRIEADPIARVGVMRTTSFKGEGRDYALNMVGRHRRYTERHVPPHMAVIQDRVAYEISPWLGILQALLVFTPPMVLRAWRQSVRRRRQALGECLECGYDLHASPERCPECGTDAARPPIGAQ